MKNYTKTQVILLIILPFVITRFSQAEEANSLKQLKTEKEVLEKRLKGIDLKIDKMWAKGGVKFLGMTLMDSSDELIKKYGLSLKKPQPIITKVHDSSFFTYNEHVPVEGCRFWIVSYEANEPFFKEEKIFYPKTVRELISAIVSSSISPKEMAQDIKLYRDAIRARVALLPKGDPKREKLLKTVNEKLPKGYLEKYHCRVVYIYPNKKETMTTYIQMDKSDLDNLKLLLRK